MTREEQSVKMGKRLKSLRENTLLDGKKMSHVELKKKLKEKYGVEISRDSLMNYEVSDINHSKFGTNLKMSAEYLNCLAYFYGVSTDYLLCRSDAKTADENVQVACKTTGLSAEAIAALKFDSGKKKERDILGVEDFLIKNLYISCWARYIRDSVRNMAQLRIVQSKLDASIVSDKTDFYRWRAMREFERSLNEAIREFSSFYTNGFRIADTKAYLSAREDEFNAYLKRIAELKAKIK